MGATTGAASTAAVHVARQGIYDVDGRLAGYELLFRDHARATTARTTGVTGRSDSPDLADPGCPAGATPGTPSADGDAATTATILAAFSEFGVDDLLGGRPGFINVTRSFLLGDLPLPFAPGQCVLEILETVELTDDVVAGAERLAREGHPLALDDFVWSAAAERLLPLADVVKIDVLADPWETVLATLERCRPHGVRLLAEKVEDADMLRRCREAGFHLFQGYHLSRPETLSVDTLSPEQAASLSLLARLTDPEVSTRELETLVRRDAALVYRLLRIANSASSGGGRPVSSVRDALVMVGTATLRSWLVLLALGSPGSGGPGVDDALTRGATCERVATRSGLAPADVAFTAGLLSGVAEALAITPEHLLERMPPLAPELADALAGTPGPLRTVLDVVSAYHRGDLETLAAGPVPADTVAEAYLAALAWTTRTARALEG